MRCRSNPLEPGDPGHQKLLDLHTQILAYMRDGTEGSRGWIDDMEERALRAGASPQDIATIWEIAHRRALTMAMGKKDNPAWRTTMRRKQNLSMEEFKTKAMSMARRSAEATKRGAVAVGRGAKSLAKRAAPHVKRGAVAVGRATAKAAKKTAKFTAKQTGRGMRWTGEKMAAWGTKANPFIPSFEAPCWERLHNHFGSGLTAFRLTVSPDLVYMIEPTSYGAWLAHAGDQWNVVVALDPQGVERSSGAYEYSSKEDALGAVRKNARMRAKQAADEAATEIAKIKKPNPTAKQKANSPARGVIPGFKEPGWQFIEFDTHEFGYALKAPGGIHYRVVATTPETWVAFANDDLVTANGDVAAYESGKHVYAGSDAALAAVRKHYRKRGPKQNPTAKQKAKEGIAALLQRLGFSVRLNKNLPYVGGPGWEITMRGTGYYFPFDGGVWVRKESGATTQVEGNWNFKAPYTESGQQAAVRWVLQTEGIPVAGQNGGRSRTVNPRAHLKHPKQVKWTEGEYWPSSHYNPSPTVIYKGKELPCGCGSRDDISVWEWAEYIHVLCVNTGLGYVGLKVFDLARAADVGTLPTDHPAKDDEVGLVGEMFMDRDYDIEETFGKRGLSGTSGKKMVETLDQWIK